MIFYAAITGLTTISYLGLGFFVFFRDPPRFLYRIFLLFCATVAFWAFGYFLTLLPNVGYKDALLASRASHAVGAFIPITFLHFTLAFIRRRDAHRRLLNIGYIVSAALFVAALTPLVVKDLYGKMDIRYYP